MRFSQLLLSFSLVMPCCAMAQSFHNLDFSKNCDSSKTGLCYWDLSWGTKGSVSQGTDGKAKCLLIEGRKLNDVGFTEQSSLIHSSKGIQIITMSALFVLRT